MPVNLFGPDAIWEKFFGKNSKLSSSKHDEDIQEIVAYALLLHRRNLWVKMCNQQVGRDPDEKEIEQFNSNLAENSAEAAKDFAGEMLFRFGETMVDIRRPDIEKELMGDLRERVTKLQRAWPGFIIGVITGVIGNALYSFLTSNTDGILATLGGILSSLRLH